MLKAVCAVASNAALNARFLWRNAWPVELEPVWVVPVSCWQMDGNTLDTSVRMDRYFLIRLLFWIKEAEGWLIYV